MQMTRDEELELLTMLGLCPADFQRVQRMPTYQQGVEELQALKDRTRKAFRRVAVQLHPDQNGGDEAKTAKFKNMNELVQKVEKLQLRPPTPPTINFAFPLNGTT